MSLGSIFKNIGKGALVAADVGGAVGIPILSQIDAIADNVASIKGKTRADDVNIDQLLADIDALKDILPVAPEVKGAFESKRFKMTLIGLITTAAIHYGLPPEMADHLAQVVFYFISAYVAAETLRPSTK